MEIKQVSLVYFSATGTTKEIVMSMADGINVDDVEFINMTRPETAQEERRSFSDELVIIGAPVYGGRLPVAAVDRFNQLKGQNTLAVIVVLYGNRDFEDALLELKNLVIERGFIPVAGAAFIGEHSFASRDVPIANGRPDETDLQLAVTFGRKVKEKIEALNAPEELRDLNVPGRYPYIAGGARSLGIVPVTREDLCTVCGMCEFLCPTAAISLNDNVTTSVEQCIRCCACIKNCPSGARVFEDSIMQNLAKGLSQYFSYPKEPRIIGVDM